MLKPDLRPIDRQTILPPARDHAQEFGRRLTELRILSGWTYRELAERSGLARGTVSKLLAGGQQPNLRQLLALQHGFGMGSIEELLGPLPSQSYPDALHRDNYL